MTSFDKATYDALVEMGIPPDKAQAAAQRFYNVEAAMDWVFGEGANEVCHSCFGKLRFLSV